MEIAKLHKPQRMGNWKNVLAYSSEEDEENPDALADAEAAANADSTSTPTDSTGVQRTDRGVETTIRGENSRTTFRLEGPVGNREGTGGDPDSTLISISGGIFGFSATIEIAIPVNQNPPSPPYMGPGPVEYDQFGNPLYH